jgi:hypothetical protein
MAEDTNTYHDRKSSTVRLPTALLKSATDVADTRNHREWYRRQRATNGRPPLLDVVDPVERIHDRRKRQRQVPEHERGGKHDQTCRPAREDLLGRVVDRMEDGGRHVRLDLRRDALSPRLLETERAEQPKREQRERDERHERAKADRGRVDEQPVLAELGG